jgi:hypothetical protein
MSDDELRASMFTEGEVLPVCCSNTGIPLFFVSADVLRVTMGGSAAAGDSTSTEMPNKRKEFKPLPPSCTTYSMLEQG